MKGGIINEFSFCGSIDVPKLIPSGIVTKGINAVSGLIQTVTNKALKLAGTKVTIKKVGTGKCPEKASRKKLIDTCLDPPLIGKTCMRASMTKVTNTEYSVAVTGHGSATVKGMAKQGGKFGVCLDVVLPSYFNMKGVNGVFKKANNMIGKAVAAVTKAGEGVSALFSVKGGLNLGGLRKNTKCNRKVYGKNVFDNCVDLGPLGKGCISVNLPKSEVTGAAKGKAEGKGK